MLFFLLRLGRMRLSFQAHPMQFWTLGTTELPLWMSLSWQLRDTHPFAGLPQQESERRREWAKIPRKVRLGIRRLRNKKF